MTRIVASSPRRVAVVGGGVAGLICAHRLHRDHDVTLFEAAEEVGGHVNTVDVEVDGERHAVDTGFIVFNEPNYPGFVRVLESLDVETQPTSMSFSVRCDRTGIEYNGTSLNRLFAQRRNLLRPRFHRMVRDILRFNREARAVLREDDALTVAEYVADRGYSDAFVEHYLVPLGASLWSCPPGTFRAFPVRFVVEFLDRHLMLQVRGRPVWRVVRGGSRRYVEALIRPFAHRIRPGTPVFAARRRPDRVDLVLGRERVESFDEVIFACHADEALAILEDPTPTEREVLGAFPYERNEAVLHTDASVLPRRRLAWAAWNYHAPADDPKRVAVTYNMNILQGLRSRRVFCVTLNDEARIDPRTIIDRFVYHHPVYAAGRAAAQRRHADLIGVNRTSFCGAYWGYGFHEDGVQSALRVCRSLQTAVAA